MKRNLIRIAVFWALLVVTACNNRATVPENDEEEVEEVMEQENEDSILSMGDTLMLDEEIAVEDLPAAIDELFDDFVFNFDQSNRFQRHRINFPFLFTNNDGTVDSTSRRDWKHHFLFMQKDFYTVLFNYMGQIQMTKSTGGEWADVEQIFLHNRHIHNYHFERDSVGRWFMVNGEEKNFEESEIGSFLDFYRQFSTDSIYQREHLSNTIQYTENFPESEDGPLEGTISADQWFEFAPMLPRDVITNIRYGQTYDNPSHMIMAMYGIANGFQVLLTFQNMNKEWKLTGLEN